MYWNTYHVILFAQKKRTNSMKSWWFYGCDNDLQLVIASFEFYHNELPLKSMLWIKDKTITFSNISAVSMFLIGMGNFRWICNSAELEIRITFMRIEFCSPKQVYIHIWNDKCLWIGMETLIIWHSREPQWYNTNFHLNNWYWITINLRIIWSKWIELFRWNIIRSFPSTLSNDCAQKRAPSILCIQF